MLLLLLPGEAGSQAGQAMSKPDTHVRLCALFLCFASSSIQSYLGQGGEEGRHEDDQEEEPRHGGCCWFVLVVWVRA